MGRLSAQAKYIYHDGQKFFARGLSYGPFEPNSRGESYPQPERVAADLALMRELGANLIRTYTMPPPWLFELSAKHGLRLMVGISWPLHLAFLDSPEMVRDIRDTVRREVAALRPFKEAIFAYGLGNEIRADIVRWHGPRAVSLFLAELYDIGKQLDPEGLFTYSNYPSVEYLDLSFLDIISFNVYLHRESDYRRYLTHLMALAGERPLVLSETGIDTIREGELHQAELLRWQSRAALELGLSGVVVFAFTDEWFRGGFEITDWAFGVTTRQREPKPSFAAVGGIYQGPLPPTLEDAPSASVIVPAYNAAPTLARCLESLERLNYPDYEVIVVDDGSTDATVEIADSADVRTLKLPHNGLAAARNAGLEAARGRVVAFIDADAQGDPDWLYHLAETITRRNVAAAGGQNFAPRPKSALAAAIAAAPGQAREVRLGDQDLAQLCGCSMAIDKLKCGRPQPFDPIFTTAGDDVDLSWSLREAEMTLAYAPGAVVVHQRRATIGAYLKQQRGYGHAEGLLFRKYPYRSPEGVYRDPGWFAHWFGRAPRIYYGAFGRGLFQTIYPGMALPMAAELPLTFQWVAVAVLLAIAGGLSLAGSFDPIFAFLGILGLFTTALCACAGAAAADGRGSGFFRRAILALLWLLGSLVRSWERERVKLTSQPDTRGAARPAPRALSGIIVCTNASPGPSEAAENQPIAAVADVEAMAGALHSVLVRRGLAVRKGTNYDPFDLQIIVAPWIRVGVLFLNRDGALSVAWRTRPAWGRVAGTLIGTLLLFLLGGSSFFHSFAAVGVVAGLTVIFALAIMNGRRVPAVISAASSELSAQCGWFGPASHDGKRTGEILA